MQVIICWVPIKTKLKTIIILIIYIVTYISMLKKYLFIMVSYFKGYSMDANTNRIGQYERFHWMERRKQQMWCQRTALLLAIKSLPIDHQRTPGRDNQTVHLHGMPQLLPMDFRSNWWRIFNEKKAKHSLEL